MIRYSNLEKFNNFLSVTIQYGFTHEFHPKAIEERIIRSEFINELEKNNDSFFDEYSVEEMVMKIYGVTTLEKEVIQFTNLSLWLGIVYFDIFFQFKKSFSYIFAYLPIDLMIEKYGIYHEMDISQLFDFFCYQRSNKTLLSLILKNKKITTKQLSVLSGISINTLNGYCKDDDILFGASFENISLISQILDVKSNMFLKRLYISLYSSTYLSREEKIQLIKDSYEYFNTKELDEKYVYDQNKNALLGKNKSINLIVDYDENYSLEKLLKVINEVSLEYDGTIVFGEEMISNLKKDVININNDTYVDVKKGKNQNIPSLVKEYASIKADTRPYKNYIDEEQRNYEK